MNITLAYKHLESKLRIGEFTLMQWAIIVASALLGLLWGFKLSPLPHWLTMFTAIYIAGIPVAVVFIASLMEFQANVMVGAVVSFWRAQKHYLPGGGTTAQGYWIDVDEEADSPRRTHAQPETVVPLNLEELWQS